ncbi:MAG: Lcl C-terminal domain-containing protein [Polyangiales bacterium]
MWRVPITISVVFLASCGDGATDPPQAGDTGVAADSTTMDTTSPDVSVDTPTVDGVGDVLIDSVTEVSVDAACHEDYPAATGCPDFEWACWPLPASSPGSANYQAKTICGDDVVIDKTTKLMWDAHSLKDTLDWAKAKAACMASTRAGFADWRLPTRVELLSIVDFDASVTPTIETTVFPNSPMPIGDFYWTATLGKASDGTSGAYVVGFGVGPSFIGTEVDYPTSNPRYVRCVR